MTITRVTVYTPIAFQGGLTGSLFLECAITAVREASLTRLRPVLMRSAATVFGHFPLVLVSGPGAEARNSIGIVLATGMIVGTLFTLFVAPVFYTLIAAEHRPDEPSEAVERTAPDGERAQPIAGIA
jgi:multidrug efflux pump